MPLFHHKSDDEKQREAQEKARRQQEQSDQEASLRAIETGGIPVQAQRRLDQLRSREGSLFTSDLSVDEFLLSRQAGLRPVSQVMGSSIYHVGWQTMPGWSGGPFGYTQELTAVSQAMNDARRRALSRLAEEAERVGADVVVGVHVQRGRYDWGENLIEFNAVGTAARLDNRATSDRRPSLTNLSGQDFWKLYQAGYWPLGVAAWSTVFYVVASWQTQMASSFWTGRFNQELEDFTQGVYGARHHVMGQVRHQAQQVGAAGIVATQIEQSVEEHEVSLGNDQERTDLIVTFHAIGTAIAEIEGAADGQRAVAVLNLKDRATRRAR